MTAFSQITGLSLSQKQEIVKGLRAQESYKFIIKDCDERIDEYLELLNAHDSLAAARLKIIEAKNMQLASAELNQMVLQSRVNAMIADNRKVRNKLFLWKGLAIMATITTGYFIIH